MAKKKFNAFAEAELAAKSKLAGAAGYVRPGSGGEIVMFNKEKDPFKKSKARKAGQALRGMR